MWSTKLLGVFYVVRGLALQGLNNVGQLLGDTIGDCSPTEYNVCYLVNLGESIKLGGTVLVR